MRSEFKDQGDACVPWKGFINHEGYGRTGVRTGNGKSKNFLAHRLAWVTLVGEIPERLVIDHLCRNRACVNVRHMELVTPEENVRRSEFSPSVINANKSACDKGHPFSVENTYMNRGRRHCRPCHRERNRKYYARLRAERKETADA